MWVVVYVAPNRRSAIFIKELLEFEGILVKFKGINGALTQSKSQDQDQDQDQNIEIMVSDLEIEEANEVINNALQEL